MFAKEATIADYRQWYEQAYSTIERECATLGHSLGFNPPVLNSVESLAAKPPATHQLLRGALCSNFSYISSYSIKVYTKSTKYKLALVCS